MSRRPITKWAQRSDKVYLTVDLAEAKDVNIKLEPEGGFIFSGVKDGIPYELNIQLFDKINVEESKLNVGLRDIACVIKKEEKKWWSRLIKQEGKPPLFLKVDWDKWIDEEDEDEERAAKESVEVDSSKGKTRKGKKRQQKLLHKWLMKLRMNCLGQKARQA